MILKNKLREDFQLIFRKQWPVWVGGAAIGIINVFLFTFYQPWSTLDGILNWGEWSLGGLGIITADPLSPIVRTGSVINFGLLFGAFFSALLARQFAIRIGPFRELMKGLAGGILIGIGAVLARGCNIGGFFSATGALSSSGLVMAAGLVIGAFIGVRYLMWEMEHTKTSGSKAGLKLSDRTQSIISLLVLGGFAYASYYYIRIGLPDRTLILLFGLLLGIVTQRSRICFVRAFREPFLTGDASHTKAMLLALVISVSGMAIVKFVMFDKVDEFVRATYWFGSLLGGTIFGVGMVLAGGCGGGTIWRVGEGHVKLWMTLLGYIVSATLANEWLMNSGNLEKLGEAIFMPDVFGWGATIVGLFALFFGWYLIAHWNEVTRRFAAI